MVGLKSLCFGCKFKIFLVKVDIKPVFLSDLSSLLSKKADAKSKHFSERLFSEIFGKPFLLGLQRGPEELKKFTNL